MGKVFRSSLFIFLTILCTHRSFSSTDTITFFFNANDTLVSDLPALKTIDGQPELMSAVSLKPDEAKRKKLISAMLAFPFPFGFMGAHRVMLGCKPWIPVVYVATFGGCFGLLPMIDFCAIVFSKDITQYENNPHVFMWLK